MPDWCGTHALRHHKLHLIIVVHTPLNATICTSLDPDELSQTQYPALGSGGDFYAHAELWYSRRSGDAKDRRESFERSNIRKH